MCCHFYGGMPSAWLDEPHGNLIAAFQMIPRIRDTNLLYERAYMNMEAKDLNELRRSMEIDTSEPGTMDDIRARMTQEQRQAHDEFIKRHSYSVAGLL